MEFYLVLIEEKKDMKIFLIKHTLQTHLTFNKPRTWRYYASFAAGLPFRFCFAGVSKTEKRKRYSKISPSTVFSTFDRDQKQKSVNTAGKNALKSVKLPTLKVIC